MSGGRLPSATFWQDRKVLVTGHTGFKGAWLCAWLCRLGAQVSGYALAPTEPRNLFQSANLSDDTRSVIADVRDPRSVAQSFSSAAPDVVFHLAAQPLVRVSYAEPVTTFETNVIGTANVLDAARQLPSVRAIVVVTTDKCYADQGWPWPYRETDPLGGYDPYAASKACAELVTSCYRDSFFGGRGVGVATARGGNVVGGGDWTQDRLLPDVIAACERDAAVQLRYPTAIRPWQHVLDLLCGYLVLAEKLAGSPGQYSEPWNFGPDEGSDVPVLDVARRVVELWGAGRVDVQSAAQPHESATLRLDSTKARAALSWRPRLSLEETLQWTVAWYKGFSSGRPARELLEAQCERYEGLA